MSLESIEKDVREIKDTLIKHVSYEKGLEIPERVKKVEREIRTKPSFGQLITMITVIGIVISAIVSFIK